MPAIFSSVIDKLLAGFTAEEVGFLKSMLRRVLVTSGDQTAMIRDLAITPDNK
jgi:hypothetical protein